MKKSIGKRMIIAAMLVLSLVLLAGCAAPAPEATATPEATAAPTDTAAPTTAPAATETATQEPTRIPIDTVAPTEAAAATAEVTATPDPNTVVSLPTFTASELAKYDGTNGNPAYIAVDGIVYDVSNVAEWKGGSHFGRYQAGKDLTDAIKQDSPHGVSKLASVPVVGLYQP